MLLMYDFFGIIFDTFAVMLLVEFVMCMNSFFVQFHFWFVVARRISMLLMYDFFFGIILDPFVVMVLVKFVMCLNSSFIESSSISRIAFFLYHPYVAFQDKDQCFISGYFLGSLIFLVVDVNTPRRTHRDLEFRAFGYL